MGLFKNEVGRPSNETLERRRKFYVVVVLILVALIGVGVFYTVNYFKSSKKIDGSGKNIATSAYGVYGDATSVLNCKQRDGKITHADADAIARYLAGNTLPGFNKSNADVDDDGYVNQADIKAIQHIYMSNLGDVDIDGKITSADARLISRFAVSLQNPNSSQKKRADIDGDGKITSADARLALRFSVGVGDVCGDYSKTGDGKVTEDDLNLLLAIKLGYRDYTEKQFNILDLGGNRNIDTGDLLDLTDFVFPTMKATLTGSDVTYSGFKNRYYSPSQNNVKFNFNVKNAKYMYYYTMQHDFTRILTNDFTYSKTAKLSLYSDSVYYGLVTPYYYQNRDDDFILNFLNFIRVIYAKKLDPTKITMVSKPQLSTSSYKTIKFKNNSSKKLYYVVSAIPLDASGYTFDTAVSYSKCQSIGKSQTKSIDIKLSKTQTDEIVNVSNTKIDVKDYVYLITLEFYDGSCYSKEKQVAEQILYVPKDSIL